MLPARRIVSKESLHEEHSSKTFGLRLLTVSCLFYELGLREKIFNENSGILWKMDIVKMTHFTLLVKLKILKEQFLLWKCYLETDWNEEKSQCQKSVGAIFHII